MTEGVADHAAPRAPLPGGWRAGTFAAFQSPGYSALWLNALFVTLGVVMCITTQFIVVADLTGSNRGVGAVTFGLGVPMLVLGPIAGVLADRLSKRLVLFGCQATMAAASFSLGGLILADLVSMPWVLLLSVMTGACLSMMGPTQIAFMGGLVRPEGLGNATALFQACLNLTRVIGPFVVAAFVAIDAVGPAGSFFAVSILFATALIPLAALPPSGGGSASVDSIFEALGIGIRHVLDQPSLKRLVVAFVCVTLLGFSHFVVLPRFAQDVLGAGDSGYGILVGVSSIGGLTATVLVAQFADSPRLFTLLRLSAFFFGLALIAVGAAPSFAVALVAMVLVGASASAFQALNNAAAFREANPAYLGRVTALMNLAWSITNLIGLPVGFIADAVGERTTLYGVGAALCLVALLLALWGGSPSPSRRPARG